jgi:hypothetical protein
MSAKILLAANAALTSFGPYAVGDADTETVRPTLDAYNERYINSS